jgi:hypothetical protein
MTTYIPEPKLKPIERILLILAVILVVPIAMFPPLLLAVALVALPVWLICYLGHRVGTRHRELSDLPTTSRRMRLEVPSFENHARIHNHWTVNYDRPGSKY